MTLDHDTKQKLSERTAAEREAINMMRMKLHMAVTSISTDAHTVLPALMILLADLLSRSENSTNDIVAQFRMCLEESRGEGKFTPMGRV